MKRFLIVMLLVAIVSAGVAFYRGWIGVTSDSAGGTSSVTFYVNQDKFHSDFQKAMAKVKGGDPAVEAQ